MTSSSNETRGISSCYKTEKFENERYEGNSKSIVQILMKMKLIIA